MTTHLLATILVARALLSAAVSPPDPCALVSAAEIGAVLGLQPSSATRHGPTGDKETGARAWSCDRQAGEIFLAIGYTEFPSAAVAAAGLEEAIKIAAEDPSGIQLSPQKGLADGAVYGADEDGAVLVVRKGRYTVDVTLAGQPGDDPRLREKLSRLASLALGRL